MPARLNDLASRFDCRLQGDGSVVVTRVATLSGATPEAISFLANPLYRTELGSTQAGAVILRAESAAASPVPCLITENPYAVYARVAAELNPPAAAEPGIAASAVVDPSAEVAGDAEIGPRVVVGAGATIGAGAIIGAGTVIGPRSAVGAFARIAALVSIGQDVRIGARSIVHSGVVIGSDGFGFAEENGRWIKVPQLGGVVIGDDVEIGANTTIDRGAIEDTVIEDGVKLDNQIQIAHNVRVGAHTVMAAFSGIAGSTTVGRRCKIGGGVTLVGHLSICDDVMFTFQSVVMRSVSEPGVYGGSLPADDASKWRRSAVRFRQLDSMYDRLKSLEQRIGQLTGTKDKTR